MKAFTTREDRVHLCRALGLRVVDFGGTPVALIQSAEDENNVRATGSHVSFFNVADASQLNDFESASE